MLPAPKIDEITPTITTDPELALFTLPDEPINIDGYQIFRHDHLGWRSAVKSFNLKPTVTFPTRGDRILDQIFMNLGHYFSDLIRLPPFGLSDHATVYIGSSAQHLKAKTQDH